MAYVNKDEIEVEKPRTPQYCDDGISERQTASSTVLSHPAEGDGDERKEIVFGKETSDNPKYWRSSNPGRGSFPVGWRSPTNVYSRITDEHPQTEPPDILLTEQIEKNPDKAGLAILCANVGSRESIDFIAKCSAIEKMQKCFGDKLGYLTVPLGMNVTSLQLKSILQQVKSLNLPQCYRRVIFYFFGHGNDSSIKLADEYFERQDIICGFQSICPPESDVFKIFLFDSCRSRCDEAQQGGVPYKTTGQYPNSSNTLVINATESDHKAFYIAENGCGLMTQAFADLAPTLNESICNLLSEMRERINTYAKSHNTTQILVYQNNLMGNIYFLAESKGSARVIPLDVSVVTAVPSPHATNVQWQFDKRVDIKHFEVEVKSRKTRKMISTPSLPNKRLARIPVTNLEPNVIHDVKVVAVYGDGTRAESGTATTYTKPATVKHNIFHRICCTLILATIIVLGLSFIPLVVFETSSQSSAQTSCLTYYIRSPDTVLCGQAFSTQDYSSMEIRGTVGNLQGLLEAWLVHKKDLKLYSQIRADIHDDGYYTNHKLVLLNGWRFYAWENSTISGNCCVTNNGSTDKTTSLYIFSNQSHYESFSSGAGPPNAILSENIMIPPNTKYCFKKWAPFIVKHSSYHFFALDLSAEMAFSSYLTLNQTFVNTTDYGTPHYFRFDNSTRFNLSSYIDYVAICSSELNTASEHLYIYSCNEPKPPHSKKPPYTYIYIIGALIILIVISTITLVIVFIYIHQRKRQTTRLGMISCQRTYGSRGTTIIMNPATQ